MKMLMLTCGSILLPAEEDARQVSLLKVQVEELSRKSAERAEREREREAALRERDDALSTAR